LNRLNIATEQELEEVQTQRSALDAEFNSFRNTAAADKRALQSNLSDSSAEVQTLEKAREDLRGQIADATVTAERCVADVGDLGEQLIAALGHLEQLEAALAQAQAGRSALAAELAAVRKENGDGPVTSTE
jgi:chromosome segregation ATPase